MRIVRSLPVLVLAILLAGVTPGALRAADPSPGPTADRASTSAAGDPADPVAIPNLGQQITPLAPAGATFAGLDPQLPDHPGWLAGQAVSAALSPDGRTLLVLTSGYNRIARPDGKPDALGSLYDWPASQEYVFVYDVSGGAPVQQQVVTIPNTYHGLAWDPSGAAFYVSGGRGDAPFDASGAFDPTASPGDDIHVVTRDGSGRWARSAELLLGHTAANGLHLASPSPQQVPVNQILAVSPMAAGIGVSGDGRTLVVANYGNDSVTVFRGGLGRWDAGTELDLRPGRSDPSQAGVPGGEYPFWVAVAGSGPTARAYVSSVRDREVVVVGLAGAPAVIGRIPVRGQPTRMVLDAAQAHLYVVTDQADAVAVIDTATDAIVATIPVLGDLPAVPAALDDAPGAVPTNLALTPDGRQLWVTLGGLNAVAVIHLGDEPAEATVTGLIPTGWFPTAIGFSEDGRWAYVANGKSPTGPNPGFSYSGGPPGAPSGLPSNEYNPQLTHAGLQAYPVPAPADLDRLTAQVATNDRFGQQLSAEAAATLARVRAGVHHVIFVVKENRTYDQVLGDLEVGDGDPSLAEFGAAITPNQHALARQFVTLDDTLASAEVSYDGWAWTTAARADAATERDYPLVYAGRGGSLESEGAERNVNVALPTVAERQAADPATPDDPDLLPGTGSITAPDGPGDEPNTGFLWDAVLRAGLSVRNYGFFVDPLRYTLPASSGLAIPVVRDPAASGLVVSVPTNVALMGLTDPYYRGFDPQLPDTYRESEWERDTDARQAAGQDPPALTLIRLMLDHTGGFATAIDGVDTPETQVADNDLALGRLVEHVAAGPHADDTLIFVIEDDAQDGADHVDSHRTVALILGSWVRRGAVVSTQHSTIDFLRTIEEVLGIDAMNLNDALARPMAEVFADAPQPWSYTAVVAPVLYTTQLPLPPRPAGLVVPSPRHDAAWWTARTAGMDFTSEDRIDDDAFSRLTWEGVMGDAPYPTGPTGLDLRTGRAELLARYGRAP
ncbi:MAG: YncE family protein [Chloroflexota bacterium]